MPTQKQIEAFIRSLFTKSDGTLDETATYGISQSGADWIEDIKAALITAEEAGWEPDAAARIRELESDYLRRHKDACDRWERIKELEAERDKWRAASGSGQLADLSQEALAMRSAIEAAMIERCAEICDEFAEPATAAEAIRALAKPVPSR